MKKMSLSIARDVHEVKKDNLRIIRGIEEEVAGDFDGETMALSDLLHILQVSTPQLLGQLPLHITLREDLDNGTPTVVARPDSEFTDIYRQLAGRVAAQMYWQGEVIPGEIAFRAV